MPGRSAVWQVERIGCLFKVSGSQKGSVLADRRKRSKAYAVQRSSFQTLRLDRPGVNLPPKHFLAVDLDNVTYPLSVSFPFSTNWG